MEHKYKNKCSVPSCTDKLSRRHRFPRDPKLCQLWVENIQCSQLRELSVSALNKKFVCENHFTEDSKVPGTMRGLRKDAVPTINLPSTGQSVEIIADEQHGTSPATSSVATELVKDSSQSYTLPGSFAINSGSKHEGQHKELIPVMPQPSTSGGIMSPLQPISPELPASTPTGKKFVNVSLAADKTPVKTKKTHGILQQVGVTRQRDLTPRCQKFYKAIGEWGKQTAVMQHKINNFKERLRNATMLAGNQQFCNLLHTVNESTYTFIMQQIRTQQQKPRARRFSLNEKILCLSLLKASGIGYRLISMIFSLPSRRTLTNLLNQIPYQPGINKNIFGSIRQAVQNLKSKNDKLCVVVFDELAIKPLLTYNRRLNIIEGLEDYGNGKRKPHIADHANIFMIKGINRQWKQAVSFTFSNGPIKSGQLKSLLIEVIKQCQEAGLEVIGTVCDQGSANQAVINSLLRDTAQECLRKGVENKYSGFCINEQEVIPLFDVPHLFKRIRNNLLTKDLYYQQDGQKKIARWQHIVDLYMLDRMEFVRLCPKLTDGHVMVDKVNKMKVSTMTRVFSHSVGALLKRLSKWDTKCEYDLPNEAEETGDFILFMDELFDSLNGNSKTAALSKALKGGISRSSGHKDFWQNSIKILSSITFFDAKNKKHVKVPSIVNLVKTLRGFLILREKLLTRMNYILPRAMNQDCLENFFSSLRGHTIFVMYPDVAHFKTSFKALLVNNFFSTHSPGANCEEDFSSGVLDNLRTFLTGEEMAGVTPIDASEIDMEVNIEDLPVGGRKSRVARATLAYIAGYVAKKCLKNSVIVMNANVCCYTQMVIFLWRLYRLRLIGSHRW